MDSAAKRQRRRSTDEVRDKILEEATRLFLERGYVGASMNELTTRVGGSKSTLYKQYGNKEALFTAVLAHVLQNHMQQLDNIVAKAQQAAAHKTDGPTPSLQEQLEEIGVLMLSTVSSHDALGLWRLLYSEGPNHPEIAKTFIDLGPDRTHTGVTNFLAQQVNLGRLKCARPAVAAEYFIGMVLHLPMLYRYVEIKKPYKMADIKKHVQRVTTDFLNICEHL